MIVTRTKAECLDNTGYEWLLDIGKKYEVREIFNLTGINAKKMVVIEHSTCGRYGMYAERFKLISE